MNGNNIFIQFSTGYFAGMKSDDIQVMCEGIPVSSPSDGDWQHLIAGRKSWSLTTNYLVTSEGQITPEMVGQTVTITIIRRSSTGSLLELYRGRALCTNWRLTATRGSLIQGSFQFQGSGPLDFA